MSDAPQTVEAKVHAIILEHFGLEIRDRDLEPTDKFIDDLGADDLDLVEICMALETEFGIELDDADWAMAAKQGNLGLVVDLVTHKVNDGTATAQEANPVATGADLVDATADHDPGTGIEEGEAMLRPAGLQMRYFVLSPGSRDGAHAAASEAGIRAYADAIRPTNATLADDLLLWLNTARSQNVNETF